MKLRRCPLLSALVAGLCSSAAPAAEVAVFPVTRINTTPGVGRTIGALIADAYESVSGRTALGPDRTAAALRSAGSPQGAAAALGVYEYLECSAVGLESRLRISCSRCHRNGTVIYTESASGASLDDAPAMVARIAKALHESQPAEPTQIPRNIATERSQHRRRGFAQNDVGLKAGLVLPFAKNIDFEPSVLLQFDGRFDTNAYFLELGIGGMVPTYSSNDPGYGGLFADLGFNKWLTKGSVAPYLGLGICPRLIFALDDELFSLTPYAQVGASFFRGTTRRLYIELRVAQNALAIEDKTDCTPGSPGCNAGNEYHPTELFFNIGLGW